MEGRFSLKRGNGKYFVLTVLITFFGFWSYFYIKGLPEVVQGEAELHVPQPSISQLQTSAIDDLLSQHILLEPSWLQSRDWGLVHNDTLDRTELKGAADDKETEFAWKTFFHGMSRGLFLELGAMDGKAFSASLDFEVTAGWRTILIEGDRNDALEIPKNRPSSLSLRLIVCQEPSLYHFVHARPSVGGILEFMAPDFVWEFHRTLLKDKGSKPDKRANIMDILDWETVNANTHIVAEECLPLQDVFDRYGITHINFMVLDLEGGELSALRSLDFERIRFDVMCIETNRMQDPADPYISDVVNYVTGKGYKSLRNETIGRNSWFYHPSLNFAETTVTE